jgi:hypothetical protein
MSEIDSPERKGISLKPPVKSPKKSKVMVSTIRRAPSSSIRT